MERTYIVATQEWEGYTLHGYVTGPADVDIPALWQYFRREFEIAGSARFHSPVLEQSPYHGDPPEAFVAWLIDTRGFRPANAQTVILTFDAIPVHSTSD